MKQIEDILRPHDLRLTKPRQNVFDILKNQHGPIQIGEIIKSCPNVDRVSIYRTLVLFEKINIVQVFHNGFKKGYELTDPFKEHHHHIHCKTCHAITSIKSEELEQAIKLISKDKGYELSSHHIELWGTCSDCVEKHN